MTTSSNSRKLAAGKHIVGIVGGVGLEQVERDLQKVFALEGSAQASLLGARDGDVVVPGDDRFGLGELDPLGKIDMAMVRADAGLRRAPVR